MIKELSDKESENYFSSIYDSHIKKGLLYSATIELTKKCNFSCIHCYNSFNQNMPDLSLAELKKIIDTLIEKQCLYIVLTGGEPLLYKNFKEFWIYAYEKGLLITLFTNAALINESIIKLFKKYPPYDIEISMYGYSDATYYALTGVKNQFNKIENNILMLKENSINFSVKSVAIKQNIKEIKDIYNFTKELGVLFKYDLNISPGINGKKTSHLFAPSKDIIDLFKNVPESKDAKCTLLKNLEESRANFKKNTRLYTCGAGKASVYFNSKGEIHPCTICRSPEINSKDNSLDQILTHALPKLLEKKTYDKDILACLNCEDSYFCDFCAAIDCNPIIKPLEKKRWKANICRIARLYKEHFEGTVPSNKPEKEFLVKAGYFELKYKNKSSGDKNE